jgi:hypothetical protein
MTPYRAVLLALFVVGGALTAAVPTSATSVGVDSSPGVAVSDDPLGDAGVTGDAETAEDAENAEDAGDVRDVRPTAAANGTQNNSTLGADISSFMQSSAAEVGGAVETGMWTAAFNATDNQSVQTELVDRRTSELQTQLEELRERKAQLVAERDEGNVSEVAYRAKVSRLLGQINALQSAIDATSVRASQANASAESLDDLRSESENLTGPEIAAVARNVTGVGVGNGEAGPPNGVGNGNNGNGASGTGDRTGPPAAGNGTANGTNASAPGNSNPPGDPGSSGNSGNSGNSDEAPIVGNGTANGTTVPNASAPNGSPPATPPGQGNGDTGNGNGADAASQVVASVTSAVSATPDFFDNVPETLGPRTFAVEYALTAA